MKMEKQLRQFIETSLKLIRTQIFADFHRKLFFAFKILKIRVHLRPKIF